MSGLVRVEGDGSITQVILDRPSAANALNHELLETLVGVIDEQAAVHTRAVVLSGSGGRFSAGADLDELAGDESDLGFDDAVAEVGKALAEAPFPVIAAVERYAFGAGVDLAWSCDAVVLAGDARLGVPATQLGLLYNPESLVALHTRIGDRAWRRLVLLGEELDGRTAFSLGMGEVLAEPGRAVTEALSLAESATRGGEAAVAATKRFGRAIVAGTTSDPEWQALRRELIAAGDRRDAIRHRTREKRGR